MNRHSLLQYALTALMLGSASVVAQAQDITTGLIGHWKLDESFGATTAVDTIAGRDGTVQGNVTPGLSGRVNNGYIFNGTSGNRVLTTATSTNLNIDTEPFSMFAFMKTPDPGVVQQHIISGNNGAAGRWNLGVLDNIDPLQNDGVGELFWFHNGGVNFVGTGITVSDNVYHLVGVSRDASNNWTAYVDTQTFNLGNSAGALGTSAISFGERPNAAQFPFEGVIDDVRIYDRILSAVDIQAILAQPAPPPSPPIWIANASGEWTTPGNWSSAVPNSNTATAVFGPVITANRTVIVDSPVTAKQIDFDNTVASYVIAGTSSLTLDSNSGNAKLNGLNGAHEFQVAVSLSDAVDANVAASSTIEFENALNLNGLAINKSGAGRLNVNNLLNSGTGSINVSAGTLGGNGEVGGNLNNQSGGAVAPGTSVGKLLVDDNYSQVAGAKLQIELGGTGAGQFDVLQVGGSASLSGLVEVSLVNGFTPALNATFPILTAAGGVTNLGLTASAGYSLIFNPTSVALKFNGTGFSADFNDDGFVNGTDLTLWRGAFGTTSVGDADGDLDSDGNDFLLWQRQNGSGPPAEAASAVVPEPASAVMTLLACLAGVQLTRKR